MKYWLTIAVFLVSCHMMMAGNPWVSTREDTVLVVRAHHPAILKVLFLGNSYTYVNDLPLLIHHLARAQGDSMMYDSHCPGGYTLHNHATDPISLSKINADAWNWVVLQAQSQEPAMSPAQVALQTLPYAMQLDSAVDHHDSCTMTLFYETWGRKNGDATLCPVYPPVCTYTGMQNRLKESYKLFADTCRAVMAPAGEAWRKSIALNPSLELYQPDESHPSPEGSYLTACVFYEILFKKSVVNNPFTAGCDPLTAGFLQQVAHAVVRDSLEIWNVGKYHPCDSVVGIPGSGSEHTLILFPNPACDILHIPLPDARGNQPATYIITDLAGRVCDQGALLTGSISIAGWPAGCYLMMIRTANSCYRATFVTGCSHARD